MYGAARHGRAALRALPSLAQPSIASLVFRIPLLASKRVAQRLPVSRAFSSSSRYLQHAVAQDMGAEDVSEANHEFTTFEELAQQGIMDRRIIDTLTKRMNIHTMTEVQRMTLNQCLDGSDVVAQARTGTGKTLAFLLPIVQRILKDPELARGLARGRAQADDIRALIISPTRELAEQIGNEAKRMVAGTNIQVQTAVGGTQKSYHLRQIQRMGCHILVGTPGRVNDILSDPYSGIKLDKIQTFVLDEADRLLDIGFAPAIAEIESHMPNRAERDRQTLMFSATIARSVVGLVRKTMKPDFKFVRTIDPNDAATHESVPQHVVFLPGLQNQIPAIAEIAYRAVEAHKRDPENNPPFKAIVFQSSLNEVNLTYEVLKNMREPSRTNLGRGMFGAHPLDPCRLIHLSSRLTQAERTRNSDAFRNAASALLVASDVAARGMDFPNVSHVIQVGFPQKTEDYVHRLGRTGRAGKPGQGWLLLQDDQRRDFVHLKQEIHAHNIAQDETLETAKLDMTQASQLSPDIGRLMKQIEMGIRSASFRDKAATYMTMLGVMSQNNGRPKQTSIDMVNELARFGWGMETIPTIPSAFASKLGLRGLRGLQISDSGPDDRRSSARRESYSQDDPFGTGFTGKGVSSGVRGDRFGGERFGSSRNRSFQQDTGDNHGGRRGGGFDGRRSSRW